MGGDAVAEDAFQSSDSVRSGRPLRHAQSVTFDGPVSLELGGRLPSVTVAYETYGRLNGARDNAVLVGHAISGDSHVARHDPGDDPGWWDVLIGPGKPIDTNRWFVICPNNLGGCRGTTGPGSANPETGQPYGADFPVITIGDMVEVQRRLVDHLGIRTLHGAVGGSMGGHQVLTWAVRHPDRLRNALAVATSPRLTTQALAFDVVGRNAIRRDPDFRGGRYYGRKTGPSVGLAVARMLGHITYLSPEAMNEKFEADRLQPRDVPTEFEKRFSVGSYLAYQGDKFVERFDANSYIALSMAIDLFDLGRTPQELEEQLGRSRCRWLVLSFTSDWLFPPAQSQEIVDALLRLGKPVTYCNVESGCGHDAFLLEDNVDVYGGLIRAHLENAGDGKGDDNDDVYPRSPTSIFHPHRLDYDRILDLVPREASVLDVGCGPGGLLSHLKRRGNVRVMGLELDEQAVLAAVRRGLDVVQADVNRGLPKFGDGQFDFVVLSQTLQAVRDVDRVISDILRVGRRCVVSFPNFAYHKLRTMLAEQGRAPESPSLLRFKWHNTPNIRFFSIDDFEEFCRERGIRIHQRIALHLESGREVAEDPNRMADMAIFVISR
jgi:homoserine O-acetyltransferase